MSKVNTYYNQTVQSVAAGLRVDVKKGIKKTDVATRQSQYGLNQLPSGPKKSAIGIFLAQFKDVLIFVLIIAATVSLGLSFLEEDGTPTEALLIYGIVIAIALVGFFNEFKAEKTVEALRRLMSQNCRVRRDGVVIEIPTNQLVPGDIVLLDEGKKIPADIRIVMANRLKVNEASLTGESLPVSKESLVIKGERVLADQTNMLFSGTLVATGTAEGIVVATGASTEIGRIAKLVGSVVEEQTPMQRKLDDLGKKLGLIILVICVAVFFIILFMDQEVEKVDLLQKVLLAFTAAVALAVAAIPEGLAFVVRISLALGARRMAAKNALVRRLAAVESLGSTDVICSDKTGTLTKGEMTVRVLVTAKGMFGLTGSGYETTGSIQADGKEVAAPTDVQRLTHIGLLCNNASLQDNTVLGDPTEGCLLVSAIKAGHDRAKVDAAFPRIDEIPFSSNRKMMSTLHKNSTGYFVAVKGAPDVLLERCSHILVNGKVVALTAAQKSDMLAKNAELASQALRVLAFAYREDSVQPNDERMEHDLIFVGLQGMMDPPRTEVKEVIARVQTNAGMRVIMITGDSPETAKAVASEIGIVGQAITGLELDKMSEAQFIARVEKINIYARVNPEHKIRIVQALKHHGHQVAMTGDGVNDAPAIKAADIGIAMGITGTDAAKEAADMILLDDQFLTIIKAVEEGRGIFDNVRKFVNFLLSCNIGEVITVLFGILIHGNLVLTAAQLLFINIVTDGLPAVALGSDPVSKGVMNFKPAHFQQAIINKRVWAEIFIYGTIMSIVLLAQYTYVLSTEGAVMASSVVFIGMVIHEFMRLFDIRSDYRMKFFSNKLLMASLVVSLGLQVAILYIPFTASIFNVTPISAGNWLIIIGLSLAMFAIMKLLNPVLDRIGPEYAGAPERT
ncbi:MAG TPA: cation-translocating P-type ATPase [Candidatus Saccharimonadales bacterium]|nr:cation-translocating P-type ATPase [Candidatus Saccharimonadales bacterium]